MALAAAKGAVGLRPRKKFRYVKDSHHEGCSVNNSVRLCEPPVDKGEWTFTRSLVLAQALT